MTKYKPTDWQDSLFDDNGDRIQKGTPAKAVLFNKIEQGIAGVEDKIDALPTQQDIDSLTTQLADTAVNVKTYGAKGDGVTDDSLSIIAALEENRILTFPKGHYIIDSIPLGISIKGIAGESPEATIVEFSKGTQFNIVPGFSLTDVTIISVSAEVNTTISVPSLFRSHLFVDDCYIKNVVYKTNASISGDARGSALFDGRARNSTFDNIYLEGVRGGFVLRGSGEMNNKFSNISFKNTQTGFYVTSGTSVSTDLSGAIAYSGLQFNNISLVNTEAQKSNYTRLNGADLFMFEHVENALLTNISCERAIERLAYFNCCKSINVTGFNSKYSEGFKFVGYSDIGILNLAKNFKLTSGTFDHGDNENSSEAVQLYYCEDVELSNFTVIGAIGLNTPTFNSAFSCSYYIKNLMIKNIAGANFSRNFIEFNALKGTTVMEGGRLREEYNYMNNITIDNCVIENPCVSHSYAAIMVNAEQAVVSELSSGKYVFNNFHIKNNSCIQNIIDPDVIGLSSEKMRALLIVSDSMNGLFTSGNYTSGHSEYIPIVISGNGSKNIMVNETVYYRTTFPPARGKFTSGSVFTRLFKDSKMDAREVCISTSPISSAYDVHEIITGMTVRSSGTLSLEPGESQRIAYVGAYFKTANGSVKNLKKQEFCKFDYTPPNIIFTSDTNVIYSNTDVASKVCVISAGGVIIKNNTLETVQLSYDIDAWYLG